MSFALWMILVAILLPIVTTGMAKWGASGLDNNRPRLWQETLTGWRKRADWAHRNHFEALAPFAAAVIIAELSHVAQSRIDIIAGTFIALRLTYTAMYVADWAALRSIVWSLGFICVLSLFILSV